MRGFVPSIVQRLYEATKGHQKQKDPTDDVFYNPRSLGSTYQVLVLSRLALSQEPKLGRQGIGTIALTAAASIPAEEHGRGPMSPTPSSSPARLDPSPEQVVVLGIVIVIVAMLVIVIVIAIIVVKILAAVAVQIVGVIVVLEAVEEV